MRKHEDKDTPTLSKMRDNIQQNIRELIFNLEGYSLEEMSSIQLELKMIEDVLAERQRKGSHE